LVDLHTHILPGFDDGVEDEDESVAFAKMAHADGVRTIVATPHCKEGFFFNDRATVLAGVERLRARLAKDSVEIELVAGAEVHICPNLVERIRDGRAPTLADNGKTLLLELSLTQYPVELENLVFQLKLAGILPIFAHPERIRYFQDDVKRYESVIRLGAYGQITTGSLLGMFGNDAKRFSEELVRKKLIHVLASDSHNVRGRPPVLTGAREALASMVGEDLAGRMASEIPQALLRGEEVEFPEGADEPVRRRSMFSRWFSSR